jgi:SagB-type dehydrogenase family enzyme
MNLKNIIRPYYVCGGYPKMDSWIFFVPEGEIEMGGCNKMLEVLLPLCNGRNSLDFIKTELKMKFDDKDVESLLLVLFQYLVLVDSNRIFQVFYAYSRNPMPFFESLTPQETFDFVSDQSHLPSIGNNYVEAKFEKTELQRIMDMRCSTRDFSDQAISEDMLLSLVWSAYGKQITRISSENDFLERTFNVPSGGALYPLSIYLVLFKQCGSLEKGIYLWHKEKNLLELIRTGDFLYESGEIINGIPTLDDSIGVMCVVADFERSAKKYSNKAYNLIQQEVGHVMQNVALFCAEKNIGVVEIGGYCDEALGNLLGVQFPTKAPLIVAAFGNKRR